MLKDVDAGKLDCVVVHTLDRLVRREEHFAMLANYCEIAPQKAAALHA